VAVTRLLPGCVSWIAAQPVRDIVRTHGTPAYGLNQPPQLLSWKHDRAIHRIAWPRHRAFTKGADFVLTDSLRSSSFALAIVMNTLLRPMPNGTTAVAGVETDLRGSSEHSPLRYLYRFGEPKTHRVYSPWIPAVTTSASCQISESREASAARDPV
jgi:hypothetical protein